MVYFIDIRPTDHYLEEHKKGLSWDRVIEIILTTKNPRKKGNKLEFEKDGYYILCELKNKILWVINAKGR